VTSDSLAAPVTFVAATPLEYNALRRTLPNAHVVETGIALRRVRAALGEIVVSCGVAGGLRADLLVGTVLVPREVRRPDGSILRCDPELVERFARSARNLGVEPVLEPLVTADSIVRGTARRDWAEKGYAGVDMETGLIVAPRVAAIRVVLDTPQREISADWERPLVAILKPWNWSEVLWLAREAPRAASLAARVAAGAQGIGEELRITRQ
jgi:adenosylhomocysteine nucleosidase